MDHPKPKPWHAQPLSQVYETLHSSEDGLRDAEATERLQTHGPNTLRAKPPKSILRMLKEQLLDPMVLILIGAALFSALLQEWTEAIVIGTIVVVNAVIGIVQEKKAQSSLEALRNMRAPTARVLREGEESILPASELVPGDIVFLRDGDMVPADLRRWTPRISRSRRPPSPGNPSLRKRMRMSCWQRTAPWGTGAICSTPPPLSPTDGPPA